MSERLVLQQAEDGYFPPYSVNTETACPRGVIFSKTARLPGLNPPGEEGVVLAAGGALECARQKACTQLCRHNGCVVLRPPDDPLSHILIEDHTEAIEAEFDKIMNQFV